MITYVERDVFKTITNDDIIDLFEHVKDRKGQLL